MKKTLTLLTIILLFGIQTSYAYQYLEQVGGYKGKIFKIEKNGIYKVVASVSEIGESLENLVKKIGGVAGINGAYFCPKDYPSCGGKNSSDFDRISNGKISSKWHNTGARYIFGFDSTNTPLIHQTPDIHKDSFSGIYNGLSNFPLILKEGKSFLSHYDSLIDAKMKLKGPKNFICSTQRGDIYMGYLSDMTIYDMVDALDNIGCYNALNLDAGWSLSVYDSEYKTGPGRDIMDAFVIVPNKAKLNSLDKKISLITQKLVDYINKKKNKSVTKNKLIYKLNFLLSKKLNSKQKYLIKSIIENLEKI